VIVYNLYYFKRYTDHNNIYDYSEFVEIFINHLQSVDERDSIFGSSGKVHFGNNKETRRTENITKWLKNGFEVIDIIIYYNNLLDALSSPGRKHIYIISYLYRQKLSSLKIIIF